MRSAWRGSAAGNPAPGPPGSPVVPAATSSQDRTRSDQPALHYLCADDHAGPSYGGQDAVNSHYTEFTVQRRPGNR
jgi:hypothetical protein